MVATEHGEVGGMGIAVHFDGIAPMGLAGGDEQCRHEVGIGIGLRGLPAVKEGGDFVLIGVFLALVLQQIGTDEAQGSEADTVVRVVDIEVVVGGEAPEPLAVTVGDFIGRMMTEAVAQQVDNLFLVVADGIVGEQSATLGILKENIADMDVGEVDALGTSQDVHADGHAELTTLDGYLLDDTSLALPRLHLEDDLIAGGKVVEGLVDIELQMTALDGGHELSHLDIGNCYHALVGVAVVVESQPSLDVPVGMDDGADPLGRGLYEHKVMQIFAQGIAVIGGLVVLVGLLDTQTLLCSLDGDRLEGDKEPVRRQRFLALAPEETITVFLQHRFYLLRTEMTHHKPVVCVGLIRCRLLRHSHYLVLSPNHHAENLSF